MTEQLENLYQNYKELENENQDKLFLVGKRLLEIKKMVVNDDISGEKKEEIKINGDKTV